jgi:phage shock protein A
MGLFDRMKRIVKGNVNALLDKAEDPAKVLEQAVLDMQAELAKARESLTQSMVDEKKMMRALETERATADGWRQKAGQLLAAGNETTAKEALVRHKASKELVAMKEKELENHHQMVGQLKTLVEEMGKKIEMAKLKKVELTTRIRAANTAATMNTSSDLEVKEGDAFREFQRFVDKVDEDEMRAQVMREMSGQKLDDEILKVQAEATLAPEDDELEKLKREMGLSQKIIEDKSEKKE